MKTIPAPRSSTHSTPPLKALRPSLRSLPALAASAALLLGAFAPIPAQAVDRVWTAAGSGTPYWDGFINQADWSGNVRPGLTDTAVFARFTPGFNVFSKTRLDGSEILLINFGFGGPQAGSLLFQNNWKLTQLPGKDPFFGFNSAPLTLGIGNVTVTAQHTAIIDANITLTGGLLTKKGTGTLLLTKKVLGNVLVEQGTLGGNFTTTGDLTNQATLSPGNSPGQITVQGNFRQSKNGRLLIEVASAQNFDRLTIGGSAKLDGTLDVALLDGYDPEKGRKFTFLTARSGVSGEFDDVNAPVWEGLTLRAFYEDNRVFLKVVINSFEALSGLTPNQRAVAHVLDEVIYDQRAEKVIHQLYKRDFNELPGDFDKIAPEELTSIFMISTALANVQGLNLQRRTDDLRSGSSGFSAGGLAMQGTGPGYSGGLFGAAGPSGKESKEMKDPMPPEEKKWGAFLTGVGEWVDVDGDGNARGYDITTGGFTLGLDYKVTPNFALGLAAGYAGTTADLTDDGRVWVNGGKLGLYATYFTGGFYADAAVTGGYNSYDTKRSALQGTARGDTEGGELSVLAGTGYDWKVGALSIGPTATFQYTLVGMDGFTEHGSLAPLEIHSRNAESVRSAVGFKASYDWRIGGVVIKPELRAAWQHEYGDSSYAIDASFANGAGSGFLVNGPEIGRDSLLLGAGFAIQLNESCATYLYYDGELARESYNRHSVSGGLRVAF